MKTQILILTVIILSLSTGCSTTGNKSAYSQYRNHPYMAMSDQEIEDDLIESRARTSIAPSLYSEETKQKIMAEMRYQVERIGWNSNGQNFYIKLKGDNKYYYFLDLLELEGTWVAPRTLAFLRLEGYHVLKLSDDMWQLQETKEDFLSQRYLMVNI